MYRVGDRREFRSAADTSCAEVVQLESFQPSDLYMRFPPQQIDKTCVVTVTTNKLFEYECPLPSRCAPIVAHKTPKSWYGSETIVCVGLSSVGIETTPDGEPISRALDTVWRRLYTLDLPGECDVCGTSKRARFYREGDKWEVVMEHHLYNHPLWNSTSKTFQIPFYREAKSGNGPCLAKPPEFSRIAITDWLPAFLSSREANRPHRVLPSIVTSHGEKQIGTSNITCRNGCTVYPVGYIVGDGSVSTGCFVDRVVSGYTTPFIHTLLSFIAEVGSYLVDGVAYLAVHLLDALFWLWNQLDQKFRLLEAAVALGLAVLRTNSLPQSAVITIVYLAVTGFTRVTGVSYIGCATFQLWEQISGESNTLNNSLAHDSETEPKCLELRL